MCGVAILREDDTDVALGEFWQEAADVDPGGVAVVGVPGCGGWGGVFELAFVE